MMNLLMTSPLLRASIKKRVKRPRRKKKNLLLLKAKFRSKRSSMARGLWSTSLSEPPSRRFASLPSRSFPNLCGPTQTRSRSRLQ